MPPIDRIPDDMRAAIKAFEQDGTPRVMQQSVEKRPTPDSAPVPSAPGMYGYDGGGIIGWLANTADGIPAWGTSPKIRDARMFQFLGQEGLAESAFGTVISRNAGFSWHVEGGERLRNRAHDMLNAAEFGEGWPSFISKLCWDYLCSDIGAWVEAVREEARPDAPVVGIKTLDNFAIWPTGDPEQPAWYWDRFGGRMYKLQWWQCYQVAELPARHPVYYNLQRSALSRALTQAQLWKGIITYIKEKATGRNPRAIHIVTGASTQAMVDAMELQKAGADQALLQQYVNPIVLGNPDPNAKAAIATLEMASLPDGFDMMQQFNVYITLLAMALLTDYQELAPLVSGNIGTGQQSQTLDDKAKRKGAQIFRKKIAVLMNALLPPSVEFAYDEKDTTEEVQTATARKLRAESRSLAMQNGEVDSAGARQMALDDGDMSEELFEMMNDRDLTGGGLTDTDKWRAINEVLRNSGLSMPSAPAQGVNINGVGGYDPGIDTPGAPGQRAKKPAGQVNAPADDEDQATKAVDLVMEGRDEHEAVAVDKLDRTLAKMQREIKRALFEAE